MIKYFISYADNGIHILIFNTIIELEKPIKNTEDIRMVEKLIAKQTGRFSSKSVNIITFKEIKDE